MRTVSEASVVDSIIKCIQSEYGGKAMKIHGSKFQEAGAPDILGSFMFAGSLEGITVFVEVKVDDNTPTPIQKYRLRQWGEAGMYTAAVWSLDDFKAFVADIGYPGFYGYYKDGKHVAID